MKKIFAVLAAAFCCLTTNVNAQEAEAWKGIRASFDYNFGKVDIDGADDIDLLGFSLGYVHSFGIAKKVPLFLEVGAGIKYGHYNEEESVWGVKTEENINVWNMRIPVNVAYAIPLNDKLTLRPYTGIYFNIGLAGKDKFEISGAGDESYEADAKLFDDGEDEMGDAAWDRFQVGWQIGTTLAINQFNVGLSYGINFNETAKKFRQSNVSVTLGYDF